MNECIEFEERSEAGKERNQKRVREKRNLDGNGGVMGMIIPNGFLQKRTWCRRVVWSAREPQRLRRRRRRRRGRQLTLTLT